MNRVDRLLALILYLQAHPLCTAEEMAAYFQRSVRTIYRDLAALGEAGVPVVAQAGIGYMLSQGYHLPPVSFTTEEASALITGGLLIERFADGSLRSPMRSALMKVRAVLPAAQQVQMARLEKSMATTATVETPGRAADLTLIQRALAQRRVLRFQYQGHNQSQAEEREVEPQALIHYLERWHLIAWCRTRDNYRDFRTDRIQRLSLLGKTFEPREDFSVESYLEAQPQPKLRAEIRFTHSAADRARREWWQGILAERPTQTHVTLTLAAVDWERLTGWLLSFGQEVEVLSPKSFRQQLAQAARELAKHHGKGS